MLIVDDNVDVAECFAMLLRLWGHDVRLAHNGPDTISPENRREVLELIENLK